MMIGNDYKKDIEGAKAVGMTTIFFNEKLTTGHFPAADKIISSMESLYESVLHLTSNL